MHKHIADQWVAALRSGKFTQTRGTLESEFGNNCCLGVLCNLALVEGACDYEKDEHGRVSFNGQDEYLPPQVRNWAGMKSNSGKVKIKDKYGDQIEVTLAELNDGELKHLFGTDFGFKRIAKVIEENWEVL